MSNAAQRYDRISIHKHTNQLLSSTHIMWLIYITFCVPGQNYILMGQVDEDGRGTLAPGSFTALYKAPHHKLLTNINNQPCWLQKSKGGTRWMQSQLTANRKWPKGSMRSCRDAEMCFLALWCSESYIVILYFSYCTTREHLKLVSSQTWTRKVSSNCLNLYTLRCHKVYL